MIRPALPTRTAAVAAVLAGMLVAGVGPASAGLAGSSSAQQVVGTGTFAVVPTQLAIAPPPGPLLLTYGAGLLSSAQYFSAHNTGTVALVAASYGVKVTGGGFLDRPTVNLTACIGGSWSTLLGTCSGSIVPISSWTASSAAPVSSAAVPTAPGTRIGIKATMTNSSLLSLAVAAEISISVSSGPARQIRPATTSNG